MPPNDDRATLRTLFLNLPSKDKTPSYPERLARLAALFPNSKLIDALADGLSLPEVLQRAKGFELCVLQASPGSVAAELAAAEALKKAHPGLKVGLAGGFWTDSAVAPLSASPAVDFVAPEEAAEALLEVAQDRPHAGIAGLWHREDGALRRGPDRRPEHGAQAADILAVYKRDLNIHNYRLAYLRHPYLPLAAGPGRPAAGVIDEAVRALGLFPQVKEFFLEDAGFTADLPRAAAIAEGLGKAGIVWSCRGRADIPRASLEAFKRGGLRLMLVPFESGRPDAAREFARLCRELGIAVRGVFVLGLPGETRETIEESIRLARGLAVETVEVSAARNPALPPMELESCVMRFYSRFHARPARLLRLLVNAAISPAGLWRGRGEPADAAA